MKDRVQEALNVFESMGAAWEEISLPHTEYAVAAYYLLSSSEASSNLARFDGVRYGVRADNPDNLLELYHRSRSEGFGPEVKRRIMLGTYALSSGYYDAYYLKAQQVRTLIKQDFDQAFEHFDLIIGPTTPTTAFKLGEQIGDPLTMYLNDILTIPVSLAGVPAISIPCGFAEGLPVGLQIIGKPFDESTVLRAAHAYESPDGSSSAPPGVVLEGGAINMSQQSNMRRSSGWKCTLNCIRNRKSSAAARLRSALRPTPIHVRFVSDIPACCRCLTAKRWNMR